MSARTNAQSGGRWLLLAGVITAALAALFFAWRSPSRSPTREKPQLAAARIALSNKNYALAEEIASQIERTEAIWAESRLIAGEAATRLGRFDTAADYYGSVARDGSPDSVQAAFFFGEICRELGRLTDANSAYTYVVRHSPDDMTAQQRLAFLKAVTGQRWEAMPHFMALARNAAADLRELVLLADLERPIEEPRYLEQCLQRNPTDPLVQLGVAAQRIVDGDAGDARTRLQSLIQKEPTLIAAQAMLGELLIDEEDSSFLAWHSQLPSEADSHPDVWYVRGVKARRQGELQVAARCFWQTVELAPTHRRANYQLGQALVSLGVDSADEFTQRAADLVDLTHVLDDVLRTQGQQEKSVQRGTELLEKMGRVWEACAWASAALPLFPQAQWPRDTLQRLTPQLKSDLPRTIDTANLTRRHGLPDYPNHHALFRQTEASPATASNDGAQTSIRFAVADAGIDFVYDNGADPSTKGARMFEQTGGGVAAVDYDLDGWPDLYFTQGGTWKTGSRTPSPSSGSRDRLYRNLEGRTFALVTNAGLNNEGFGQGATVGDFDNDGFPDLYVANIGQNHLYRNNGDGTFSNATGDAGIEGNDWTTSCVIVDLNGDGAPDLFDVNYVTGSDVYEAICEGLACSPKNFDGTPNRLRLSQGDGTFTLVPNATPLHDSKGLGVVAANLFGLDRPSLFIANDQVPNFLLKNTPGDGPNGVSFVEQAFVTGVAFNQDGLAMAGMGIAADDADGDGRLDFFVTNFKDESNTLYLQDTDGLFRDATSTSGLRAPSFPYVGWGTQFLDADLDGDPDLVAVNGHVDDYRPEGGEYHMQPQFFENTGNVHFVELSPDNVGAYFGKKYLGRGLARLDWNRDGLMDFAVSNIGDKASLVTNETMPHGHFLNVRLHATNNARDAIGTVVTAQAGERTITKQLLAGDGYLASNERVLQFGVGSAVTISELMIHWPSGETSRYTEVPVDRDLICIEGQPFRLRLPVVNQDAPVAAR